MKTLNLTVKKRFFDMILSGEKTEEYREMKPFWVKRLALDGIIDHQSKTIRVNEFRYFDQIRFFNGPNYSPTLPNFTIQCKGIRIGKGREEWGAEPGVTYFILILGEITHYNEPQEWDTTRIKTSSVIERQSVLWDQYFNIHNPANN